MPSAEKLEGYGLHRRLLLFIGPIACIPFQVLDPPQGLGVAGWSTAGLALWMALWWASEAVPLAVTALLPLPFLPLFGISSVDDAAIPYANPLIFLFLGGFIIALAVERWDLHRRIALLILVRAGSKPASLIAGMMLATALLSMWISNTASTMMMLPIAASLAAHAHAKTTSDQSVKASAFATAMLLGIAYAASIGGMATLIGSPPNALFASFARQVFGVEITFVRWIALGLPIALLFLPLAWFYLVRIAFPLDSGTELDGSAKLHAELASLGPMSRAERLVATVFVLVALSWLMRPLLDNWISPLRVSDSAIALIGAAILFAIPLDFRSGLFLMDWRTARRLPWQILLLFGGGLSLAKAVDGSGLAAWIGTGLEVLATVPPLLLIGATVLLIIFLTELTSNTATTATFLPVAAALAGAAGVDPLLLCAPVALAASCAFMLPVATPPNAIVFASGQVTIDQMIRAGFLLNLLGTALIALLAGALLPYLF